MRIRVARWLLYSKKILTSKIDVSLEPLSSYTVDYLDMFYIFNFCMAPVY